jgi:PRTRC genetic system ThiF family protein
MPHYTPSNLLNRRVSIALAGCGGNGSQMLTGLARLNHALTALGHPGLHVRAFDPDTVGEANMGRQLFGRFDVGSSKAIVLVNRLNAFFGLDWEAHFGRYDRNDNNRPDILIVCVDSAKARHQISRLSSQPEYIMDMGNRAADGQVIFGQPDWPARAGLQDREGHVRLPSPYSVLPELVDVTVPEDDTPSCGLAEALERQELFVNQAVVTPALNILWDFFRRGELTWHGAFVNLRTGTMRPLQVPAPAAAVAVAVEA